MDEHQPVEGEAFNPAALSSTTYLSNNPRSALELLAAFDDLLLFLSSSSSSSSSWYQEREEKTSGQSRLHFSCGGWSVRGIGVWGGGGECFGRGGGAEGAGWDRGARLREAEGSAVTGPQGGSPPHHPDLGKNAAAGKRRCMKYVATPPSLHGS